MTPDETPDRPIPNSYWVSPHHLAAGEYPSAFDSSEAATKMAALLESGIDHFIDLTETRDGLKPYEQVAATEAGRLGRSSQRESHPVRDMSVPRSPGQMTAILDAIDAALDACKTVYVHCWGGTGRTGTVVGCWLVRHGLTGDEALAQIAEWWKGVEKSWRVPRSPETSQQREYVRRWTESLGQGAAT